MLAPTMTLAAEGNPVSIQLLPLITTIVVFGVFFIVLDRKVWPRITKGLDDRQEKILAEIRAAEEARAKADAALAEYQRSLAEAKREAAAMIASAKASAQSAADDLRERNQRELAEMKDRAHRDIAVAKQTAITELHAEAATLATAIAAKILRREVSVSDQQRLVSESLRDLQPARS
jgi:F-type H+-transporting ATPase subunit b